MSQIRLAIKELACFLAPLLSPSWQLGKASCFVPFQLNWVEMSPAADIGLYCSDEELFKSLDRITTGSPLPGNVITDVNPYHYMPVNLPDDIWFFIHSKEKQDTHFGCWRTKGEACNLFSNSLITGWRSTLEFYEGQAPHEHKTDWVMQEYWITRNRLSEDNKAKEASSLCKVFFVGEKTQNHEKHQEAASGDMASHSTISLGQNAENDIGQSSSSRQQVSKDNQTGTLALEEIFPDHLEENVPENDCLSRGDYLELLDLDYPASSASSSDSSCLTMSSDECFDSLALLQDLETENNNDVVQKDAGCKFSVSASIKPTEVLVYPACSGAVNKSPDVQVIKTDKSIPSSALHIRVSDKNTLKSSNRSQKPDFRSEGTSSHSGKAALPFSTRMALPEQERKASTSRKKPKRKYFCFMPF